ncbi:MAG: transposase, partial [Phycisphaeraceae bacterium JB051]
MPRQRYNQEFRLSAVRLVTEQGYTINQAAQSLSVD